MRLLHRWSRAARRELGALAATTLLLCWLAAAAAAAGQPDAATKARANKLKGCFDEFNANATQAKIRKQEARVIRERSRVDKWRTRKEVGGKCYLLRESGHQHAANVLLPHH